MSILNLGTYPPKQCGIATFSMDLRNSLQINGEDVNIMAISDNTYHYDYPAEVVFNLSQDCRSEYAQAAGFVNLNHNIDLVVIQHEYGIFGGPDGENVLDFARLLRKPYILITHTVLPRPTSQQKMILNRLGSRAAAVVCMTSKSSCLLQDLYGIASAKINVIPHGVPAFEKKSAQTLKQQFNLTGRQIVSTFGLIGPGKGLELGIKAIKAVVEEYPEVCYLILGQTHPMLKKSEGETYRQMLEKMVKCLGLQDHVKFVNKYLTDQELGQYLYLTDIYLSPYPDRNQAVSGTMAFAIGCGRAIVSTSYAYALENLSGGRGLLAKHPDPNEMAVLMKRILAAPELKADLQKKAEELGKTWMWPSVGRQYHDLFNQIRSGAIQKEGKRLNYGGL
jgi:glycosyltransferase involved in cell wall biosynthesis